MDIKDRIIRSMKGMENKELSTHEIVEKVLHDFSELNKDSILPSDYCYNHTNEGASKHKFFLKIKHGVYKFVGENYNYTGSIEYIDSENKVKSRDSNIPDGITKKNILDASIAYINKSIPHDFSHSTTYDVLIEGERYPPKAIIGIASSYHLGGRALTNKHFSGGLHTKCFRVLKENGFNIVLKNENIVYPDEIPQTIVHREGSVKQVIVNRYERDDKARNKCIEYYGLKCRVCTCDFEEMYGDLGAGFIHVHHIIPISEIKKEYVIDPIKDLQPVCPNCHSMLHRGDKPPSMDELKAIVSRRK